MGVVVVAESEEICDRALRLIEIQWEEQPFILDMEESMKPDAPKIMPEVLRNNPKAKPPNTLVTKTTEIGDIQKGFAEADKVIEYTLTRATNTVAGVEAMACVVQWRDDCLDMAAPRPTCSPFWPVPFRPHSLWPIPHLDTAPLLSKLNLRPRTGQIRFPPSAITTRLP